MKTIKLRLQVCLQGMGYTVSTIPTAPEFVEKDEDMLHVTTENTDYLPVLDLGEIEVPIQFFENVTKHGLTEEDYEDFEKLGSYIFGKKNPEFQEYIRSEIKKRVQAILEDKR